VLDFGIARIFRRDEPAHSETLTRPGAVLGTPRYMSPEQLAGQQVDARSDLYSAALVIYEALTGTLPYVCNKTLTEMCPDAPKAFQDVLTDCLKQNPAERPATAVEVYLRLQEPAKASGVLLLPPGALDRLAAASRSAEPTVTYVPDSQQPWWRRGWVLGTAAVLVLAMIVLIIVGLHNAGLQNIPVRESVLGLEVGSDMVAVGQTFSQRQEHQWTGNPWKVEDLKLGDILKPADLGDAAALDGMKVLSWSNQRVLVFVKDDVVRALVVHEPYHAVTGRGLRIGHSESKLKQLYPEEPQLGTRPLPEDEKARKRSARYVETYRFDKLGIGFEVLEQRVKSIVLYPPHP